MAKKTPKSTTQKPKEASAAKVARDMMRFQKRRERALKKIDSLVAEIDGIDAKISTYLRDVPVLL